MFIHTGNDDGSIYDELGMLFDYRVSIGKDFGHDGDLSASLYEISFTFDTVDDPEPVSEPGSLMLFAAAGSIALGYRRRRAARLQR